MIRYLFSILLVCFLVGCQSKDKNIQAMRYHDDGSAKPMVTVVPMFDSTCSDLSWNVSGEFTSTIKTKLGKCKNIYLPINQHAQLSSEKNPFSSNTSWIKKSFSPTEFVVFLELIEHSNIPVIKTAKDPSKVPASKKGSSNLNMAVRLRIVDVRPEVPKTVLQELITEKYYIPNTLEKPNYNVTTWGTEGYKSTPMAVAHDQLSKQITERINDYVMLAKTR